MSASQPLCVRDSVVFDQLSIAGDDPTSDGYLEPKRKCGGQARAQNAQFRNGTEAKDQHGVQN